MERTDAMTAFELEAARRREVIDADVRAALRQAGRLNQNCVLPAADSAPTRPPADSTSCLTIANPMPAPPRARSRDFSTR